MAYSIVAPGKFLSLVLIFAFFTHTSLAQSSQELARMETEAKIHYDKNEFFKALTLYKKLDSVHPDNPKYMYPIIVGYMYQHDDLHAIPYIEKCLAQPEKYPRALDYFAGKAYHLAHRFDDALVHYDIYLQKLKNTKKNLKLIEETKREIESCKYAKEVVSKGSDIKIVNLGDTINSPYADYGPVLTADQQLIIFTSARPNTTGGQIDENDGRYYEDIYISTKSDKGWTEPTGIGSSINTNGHDASINLSPDGQKLLIFRYMDEFMAGSSGDLYISRLKGNMWTQPTKLSENINSKAWEPSACLSADERVLFFSSNREGGYGGTDLYMVRLLPNGEWALPMNLGNKINTPNDEDSPFIHPDGKTLYFSSNGHRTIGGFDIFVTSLDDSTKQWSHPKNIGYPINTAHDDIHFSWSADGRRVYFSSIRPGGKGDKDIYYADLNKEAADVYVVKGIISDSATGKPLEAVIKVIDNATNDVIGSYSSNSTTGKYIIILTEGRKYSMTIEVPGYQLSYENFNTVDVKGFEEVERDIKVVPSK